MTKLKVKLDFVVFTVPQKVEFAKNTDTKMTGNSTYPNPDVALTAMSAAATDLETKYNAAQGGGKTQTAAMHASELALDILLRKQAAYVNRIADGDETKILSSGFNATSGISTPAQKTGKPENLKLKAGEQAGTIIKTNDKTAGKRAFVTVVMTNPNLPVSTDGDLLVVTIGADKLIIDVSTQRNRTYKNLASGSKVYVKTFAVNTAGKSPDSDTISVTVP